MLKIGKLRKASSKSFGHRSQLALKARGVVLSRKYSEMRLANLSGAGEALRELRIA